MVESANERLYRRLLLQNIWLPLLLTAVLSIFFILNVYKLLGVQRWVDQVDVAISVTSETQRLVSDAETGIRGFYLYKQKTFLEPYEAAVEVLPQKFQQMADAWNDDNVQSARVAALETNFKRWHTLQLNRMQLRPLRSNNVNDALNRKALMDSMRSHFSQILEHGVSVRRERLQEVTSQVRQSLVFILLSALSTGFVWVLVGRKQLRMLFSSYKASLKKEQEQNLQLEEQSWLKNGQALLGESVRGELELSEIANRVLKFFADQTHAVIGAFYHHSSYRKLELCALYGLKMPLQEHPLRELQFGQTLVGQCADEKKILILNSGAPEPFKICTGVVSVETREHILFPISVDGTVKGVVELGFSKATPPRVRHLIELVSESIGIAVNSWTTRKRLEELLSETQAQTNALQSQQEELRISNEELEDQTRALRESQARLESQHDEMQQINTQLEKQAKLLERQKEILKDKNRELLEVKRSMEVKAQELERTSQFKTEFMANMSHELRTPLNSTLILAKLLCENRSGRLGPEEVEYAKTIYSSGNDLLTLINDVLDLSKVEAGKLEIVASELSVKELLDTMKRSFSELAKEKGLKFNTRIEEDAPLNLFSDVVRIEQVLRNFLSNAIKFTAQGEVSLCVKRGPSPETISFVVSDTGIGIPDSKKSLIFEAFRQADGTITRNFGGTGLGLTISLELTHLLGGEITVESQEGRGSSFALNLPLVWVRRDARPDESSPRVNPVAIPPSMGDVTFLDDDRRIDSSSKRTVLVIEDDKDFAKILYDLAHELNYSCLVACTAQEGLQLAIEKVPDAILLDMNLPDFGGLAVLDRLKANSQTQDIPVHVLSGYDNVNEALSRGAIGYYFKPVSRDDLVSAFRTIEQKLKEQIKTILVLEDDAAQRSAVLGLIATRGSRVYGVASGTEALEFLRANAVDCLILDLGLPDMSGTEFLKSLASLELSNRPAVIVYTAKSLTRREEEELQKYSQSVIIKGAKSPERLRDELSLFLYSVESKMPDHRRYLRGQLTKQGRSLEGHKVLIVDDDVRNIFALTNGLEDQGATVEVARNGRESLQVLSHHSDIELVLMDIMMPEMNGYEAMAHIRANPLFAKLPIIAITAKATKEDHRKCLAAGANDYIAKPIDLDKLLSLLRVWLPQDKTEARSVDERGAP